MSNANELHNRGSPYKPVIKSPFPQGERPYLKRQKALLPGDLMELQMLSLLWRKGVPPAEEASVPQPPELPTDMLQPQSATSLLATPRRQKLLEHIWQRTALSHPQFAWLYRAPSSATPSWCNNSPPRKVITTPTLAACSITASRSWPMH